MFDNAPIPISRGRHRVDVEILGRMRLSVQVQEDHLAALVRSPVDGLTELIWNALDADADNVEATFERNALEGIEAVRVEDDGHGMTPQEIATAFDRLGGSWKLFAVQSKTKGRSLHGKKGQGRWHALGIGPRAVWDTVADVEGKHLRTRIEIDRDHLRDAEVSAPEETDLPTGTTVRVDGITETPVGLLNDETPLKLTARFALHLLKYPMVTVRVDGRTLDPTELVESMTDVSLDGTSDAALTIIEWKKTIRDRTLYLCDNEGVALHEIPAGVSPPDVSYSAYLRSRVIRELEDRLELANFEPEGLGPLIDVAREAIKQHFEERAAERARDVIQSWQQEKVYPFVEPPRNEVETVKRKLFDVVAFTASRAVNSTRDARSRRLSLRLIEQALESEPAELRHIFEEVLKLPKEQMDWLDELLRGTTLTAIVTASRRITDRLEFLAGLERLLFDPKMKVALKERSQLHRIVRNEPWIFGEEYALAVDDRSLHEVLVQHRRLLGDEVTTDDEPVLDVDGKVRIVDLMFGGSMKQARNRREHLVVELKRPSVKVGSEELTQITKYAVAVSSDPRFNIKDVDWDFWVVSDELDAYATEVTNKAGLAAGQFHVSKEGNVRVWAVPWAVILENAGHRLKFVEDQLNYMVTEDAAIGYLQRAYERFLPGQFPSAGEKAAS
jgi:hypothetical protein